MGKKAAKKVVVVSKGLGDTVEKIIKATGLKKVVTIINKGNCAPCEKRREMLNQRFPYKK